MAYRSHASANGTGTTAQIAVPAGAAAHDIAVVDFYSESADVASGWTLPSGWTLRTTVGTEAQRSTRGGLVQAWKRLTAADAGTYDFAWTTSAKWRAVVTLYSGRIRRGDPFDVAPGDQGIVNTSSSAKTAVVPTLTPNYLAVDLHGAACDHSVPTSWTSPSPLTEKYDGSELTVASADAYSSGATGTMTFTSTGGGSNTFLRAIVSGLMADERVYVNPTPQASGFSGTTHTPTMVAAGYALGDRIFYTMKWKTETDTLSSVDNGWTISDSGVAGTGTAGADVGQFGWAVVEKIATSTSETAPLCTFSGAVNVGLGWMNWAATSTGKAWRDAVAGSAAYVEAISDTNTASPLTGTASAFAGQPTTGDAIWMDLATPSDATTSINALTLTATGLSSGYFPTAATAQRTVTLTGNDMQSTWTNWTGFAGPASSGVTVSYTGGGGGDHSGVIILLALRQETATPAVAGPLTGSGLLTAAVVPVIALAAALTGSGALSATTVEVEQVAAPLAGSGVLTATVEVVGGIPQLDGNLTGSGLLSASSFASFDRSGPLAGSGTLTAGVAPVIALDGALTGSGVLTAAVEVVTEDEFTCLDLADAVITWDSATLVGGEIVPASGVNPEAVFPTPVMEEGKRYDIRVMLGGGETAAGAVSLRLVPSLSDTPADSIVLVADDVDRSDPATLVYSIGYGIATAAIQTFDEAVGLGYIYLYLIGPVDATIEAVCWVEVEVPPEITEPEPVEIDTELVGVDPVDQEDHEDEWHDYPAVGTLATGGAWDKAFVLDTDGNAIFKSKVRLRDRIFAKNGAGAWDITVVNGKRTQMADYQLMKPFTYGPGSLHVPGLNPILDTLSSYPWLAPWTKIFVQRINEDDEVVETDYRSRLQAIGLSGADVTLDLGGMFTGPASVQWRPKPLIRRRERPTYWLHASFRKNRMPLEDVDLGFDDVTSPPQGWHLDCDLDVIAGAVKANGDALTVAYDETDKKFVSALVDRETIHATVYLDHGYMKPDLDRDFSAEKNQVYAAGYDQDGDKILFAVAPGMQYYTPEQRVWPMTGSDVMEIGTADADTTTGFGLSLLILRLINIGILDRVDKAGGYDADMGRAVTRARVAAKMDDFGIGDPMLTSVDEDLWDWIFDADETGLTMKDSRIRPAYEVVELGKYNFTATGLLRGLNPHYDASVIPVSEVVDFTTAMRKGQMRDRAKLYVFDGPNWVGTITATVTGVVAGEHNPGDAFEAADVISTRDVREGWNLWVPNFEDGTLFHISGVDVSDDGFNVKFTVDTQARDVLTIAEILERRDQEKMSPAKRLMRSGNYTKDTITGSIGEIGGKLGSDVFAPAGQWTVIPIPVGDYGLVQQIRTRLRAYTDDAETTFEGSSPNASTTGVRHAVMCFGRDVRTNNDTRESAFLDARRPDPFASGDFADTKAAMGDFKDRGFLVAWGGENADGSFDLCGYGDFGTTGGDLSGNFFEDSGFPFRAPDCVAYLAVCPEVDAIVLAGKHIWWQLDEGT